MWSMCSMSTGHSCTQAPQLVHDQITSGSITPLAAVAPTALGAGAHVEEALPGEVLDLAAAEDVGVRVRLLEVEHLAVAPHRLQRAEAVRAARVEHVHRGQDDVQVL